MPPTNTKVSHPSYSRRGLFRALAGARQVEPVRPPWSLPAAAFRAACTGCGDCVRGCPQGILSLVSGFPETSFTAAGCDSCGACASACRTGALAPATQPQWRHGVTIQAGCLAEGGIVCRVCGEHCDSRAITIRPAVGGRARPILDAAACTGCGECVAACPAGAITLTPA